MPGNQIVLQPPREGEVRVGSPITVEMDPALELAKASFQVGDACALDVNQVGGPFDAVLLANLICRVPDPKKLIHDLSHANGEGIVRQGGILMMVTPFTWSSEFTPKDKWLGGLEEAEDSFEGMVEALKESNFELKERFRMPLVIREHRRRWQYIVPDAAIFKRIE